MTWHRGEKAVRVKRWAKPEEAGRGVDAPPLRLRGFET